jgi:hypothetical protein
VRRFLWRYWSIVNVPMSTLARSMAVVSAYLKMPHPSRIEIEERVRRAAKLAHLSSASIAVRIAFGEDEGSMANAAAPTLQFWAAGGRSPARSFFSRYNSDQVLIDCGLFQGLKELRQRNWTPLPIDLAQLRSVVLTHAHIDHSGYLPRVVCPRISWSGLRDAWHLRPLARDVAGRGVSTRRRSALRQS